MDENTAIGLRPAREEDEAFLCAVYASTRRDEVAAFGWDEGAQQAFLRMQFGVRQRAYRMQFPTAQHCIILFCGEPAGQMIVNRTADGTQITDLAVLPEFRKKGIATALIKGLQDEACAAGKPVRLHVDRQNEKARRLYEGLGFIVTRESELLFEMEWS